METGEISIDESFRDEVSERPGVDFMRTSWPHGDTGPAMPHGVVWSRQ
jgi:hypothetical protein